MYIKLTEDFSLRTHGHTDKHEFIGPPLLGVQKVVILKRFYGGNHLSQYQNKSRKKINELTFTLTKFVATIIQKL